MTETTFLKEQFYLILYNYLQSEAEKKRDPEYTKECEIAVKAMGRLISISHNKFPDEKVLIVNPQLFGSAKIMNR